MEDDIEGCLLLSVKGVEVQFIMIQSRSLSNSGRVLHVLWTLGDDGFAARCLTQNSYLTDK